RDSAADSARDLGHRRHPQQRGRRQSREESRVHPPGGSSHVGWQGDLQVSLYMKSIVGRRWAKILEDNGFTISLVALHPNTNEVGVWTEQDYRSSVEERTQKVEAFAASRGLEVEREDYLPTLDQLVIKTTDAADIPVKLRFHTIPKDVSTTVEQ